MLFHGSDVKQELGIDNDFRLVTASEISEYGKVVVNPLSITVKTGNQTWVYNGQAHTWTNYTAEGIVSGHKLYNIVSTSITDVGTINNTFSSYIIVDASGKDVTKNYTVSFEEGTLTVTKRTIVVATDSATKVYDDTPLTAPSWVLDATSENSLVKGHTIYGPTPTIKQSLLEIATGSAQKTDDGDALTCDEVILSKGYLAEGHQIKIEVTGKQVGRGSSENRVSWETFRVEDENGNDVTHNYTVYDENGIRRFKFGTLTII